MRYHLTLVRMGIIRKSTNKYWRGCGEKGTLLHWECKLVQPLGKTVGRFLKKIKNRTTIWSSSSIPGYLSKEMKTLIRKDIYTSRFIVALFTIEKIWKQPECPSIDKWRKKLWCVWYTHTHTHTYIQNGILLSHKKE